MLIIFEHFLQLCGKGFTDSHNFRRHKAIHEESAAGQNEKFPCEFCGRLFVNKKCLNLHVGKKHLETVEQSKRKTKKRTTYIYCGISKTYGKTSRYHLFTEHKEEYLKSAYVAFVTQQELDKHFNNHYKCNVSINSIIHSIGSIGKYQRVI